MSWLKKLLQVFAVIGIAALSSIPFKRSAPQTSSAQGPSPGSTVTPAESESTDNGAKPPDSSGTETKDRSTAPTDSGIPGTLSPSSSSDATSAHGSSTSPSGISAPIGSTATSKTVPDQGEAHGGFSSSDRPLPESDTSSDRPASVARLEIRAPRIVGDPPRDVKIRDDDSVPAMGSAFEPLWRPEGAKAKRPAAETNGNASGDTQRTGDGGLLDEHRTSGTTASSTGFGSAPTSPSESTTKSARGHRIVYGDSLESIAQQYLGGAGQADAIYERNRDRIPDRYALPVGVELVIPDSND